MEAQVGLNMAGKDKELLFYVGFGAHWLRHCPTFLMVLVRSSFMLLAVYGVDNLQ